MTVRQEANQPNVQQQLQEDPYPLYSQWRRAGAVLWVDPMQHWFVTGHQAAMAALRNPHLVTTEDFDANGHARIRSLVQGVFTPAAVERFRPVAAELVDAALTKGASSGGLDLIAEYAQPVVVSLVRAMLGLSQETEVGGWLREVSASIVPTLGHNQQMSAAGGFGPVRAPDELRRALAAAVAQRREQPGDDLIGWLVQARRDDDRLTDDEVVDLCEELLVSAHDSTVNLIGNGAKALLDNPLQLERLNADPGIAATGVEELLRYDSPVQIIARRPVADVELAGQTVRKGQAVLIIVGAANRDPDAFEAPDMLDLSRSPNNHLAFGRGGRLCIGAPVARMAGQVAIGALAARSPQIRAAGTPTRRQVMGGRGFTSLPVAL